MHIHFFLGLAFFEENLAIVDEVKRRYGDKAKFSALVSARSHVVKMLDKRKGTSQEFYRYDWLSGLEKQWLETPLDRKKLAKYEEMLGTDTIRRIVTSDRELGRGLVSGGIVEHTKLIELTNYNDEVRWAYVVGLLDYCFEFYETEKPDMVFMYCIAGAVAFTMAKVAEYLNIPYSQPVFARVGDYQIVEMSTDWMLRDVKSLYEKALDNPSLIEGSRQEAETFLNEFLSKPETPVDTNYWIKKIMKDYSVLGMFKTLAMDVARWILIKFGLQGTKGVFRQRSGYSILASNIKKFILMHYMLFFKKKHSVDEIVGDAPFLYFPLHVEPEMTTMVFADKITNQIAIIERISKSMPAGYKLIVKEHIPCIGKRPNGFYRAIERMPDVHLISPFSNGFELLKKCALTVTITGTACWESIMMGKPPLILGKVHFTNVGEGYVYCDNLNNLEASIKETLNTKPASQEKIITYIASLIHSGFELSMINIWFDGEHDQSKLQLASSNIVDTMERIIEKSLNDIERKAS